MRKQYHFSNSERGLLAWDVERLTRLSSAFLPQPVRLESIAELDREYWFDADEERPTVRKIVDHCRLIEQADLAFPIILGADGRVMDGMHRVAKACLDGMDAVQAVRFESDPEPDYVGVRPSELPY